MVNFVNNQRQTFYFNISPKKISFLVTLVLFLVLPVTVLFLEQRQTNQEHASGNTIPQYSKFELTYPFNPPAGGYSNVYDSSVVDVEAVFTSPTGKIQKVPGFYYQDYTQAPGSSAAGETLQPNGDPVWKVRFAPSEVGNYNYAVTLQDASGIKTIDTGSFSVTASNNPGYVRTNGHHFQFDNGQFFIPRGTNVFALQPTTSQHPNAWGDGSFGAQNLINIFTQNKANFVHLFLCMWVSGKNQPQGVFNIACGDPTIQGAQTLTTMNQPNSWDMDNLVNLAEQNGIYIMPILKLRDQPNIDQGDTFLDRYAVARWGYSTSILGWDTFKEGATNATNVASYAAQLRAVDPYQHPISASNWDHYCTSTTQAGSTNRIATCNQIFNATGPGAMDIVQTHEYSSDQNDQLDNDTSLYAANLVTNPAIPFNISTFNKPYWFGETGVHDAVSGGQSQYYNSDPQGLIFHGEVWGELMTTSMAGSPWWGEFNSDGSRNLSSFIGINGFINQLPQGAIPDSAVPFSLLNDPSQVSVSDPRLEVIGRKNATFAMIHIQNETGNWAAIVRDHQTPASIAGAITLTGMQSSTIFVVKWVDTGNGNVITTAPATSDTSGNLQLTMPQTITNDIAALITAAPACTTASTPCSTCSNAAPNTCGTGNGQQSCINDQPQPCNKATVMQSCTINNCSIGNMCSNGECVSPTPSPTPTPTPTPSPTPTPLPKIGADTFYRPSQTYWGTSSGGQIWSADANTSNAFSVIKGSGFITNSTGNRLYTAILGPQVSNESVVVQGMLNKLDQGDTLGVITRYSNQNNFYKAHLDGSNLIISKTNNGAITQLASIPFTATPNTFYTINFTAVGNQLEASAWPTNTPRPTNPWWMVKTTDASLVSGTGGIRVLLSPGAITTINLFQEYQQ